MKTIDEIIHSRIHSERQKALINLRITNNWLYGLQNNYMAQFGISMAQFNILRILRGARTALSINVIRERMIECSPNTTRLMDKLLEKKLIERTRDEIDRRVVKVQISATGLELLSQIDLTFEESIFFTTNITEEEGKMLNALLDKIRCGVCAEENSKREKNSK